jgi:hypothetical protein
MKFNSNKYPACINCSTIRYEHKARGYCSRCYTIVRKKELAKLWNLSESESLANCPIDVNCFSLDRFAKFQSLFIKELDDQLQCLKVKEKKLSGPINGIDIEMQLTHIVSRVKIRNKHLFYHTANSFDHQFDMKQKEIIYKMFNEIIENLPKVKLNIFRIMSESY